MNKWFARILLAHLTFGVGIGATNIVRSQRKPAANQQPAYETANIQARPSPPQTAEDTKTKDEIDKVMQPHAVSISPYEIKRLIDEEKLAPCEHSGFFDFESIWDRLNLEISDGRDAFPARCEYQPRAKATSIELDGKPGDETLLQLDFGGSYATLYLIFKHTQSTWYLLGSIPFQYGAPFEPPSVRVTSDGRHRWLAIEYSTGHGSAFGRSADDWYEVSQSGVQRVLYYENGYFTGYGNPTIDRNTRTVACKYLDGMTAIILQSSTLYGFYDGRVGPFNLWADRRKAVFIRGPGMREFILDTQHSEMSAVEIEGSEEEITNADILKYNYRELTRLAISGSARQKDWLRNYLSTCDDGVEKQSLHSALEGARP